ncbi:hypothetical protein R5W23_003293 [Gemmata sp. JC673]|uniref:Uncharacterized protein n=1 Tax=Gemmata algarum TaxID=2975278 RepID=A0ABU5F2S3_9BACT|nr:hypothetical protein [Gemmata algarum]MDY3561865.1 hypothetical protein [Gemmata algarum]
MEAYLSYLGDHAVALAVVFAVGRALRRDIGAKSERHRVHGRYVFWWAVGAFAVGGAVGPWMGADLPNGAIGFSGFCLLGGWLAGSLHGAVVLAARPGSASRGRTPDAEPGRVGPV